MKRALCIMGPTASGKSALALALAAALEGEIVNADSMQVYRDLRVLTARPSVEEEAQARHHLYGHVDAGERYSTGRWLGDAYAAITAIRARGRTPILVGGTGLYFKALTEGLSHAPPGRAETLARLEARWANEGGAALHAELMAQDRERAARLSANDKPRILRALSVFADTGRTLGAFGSSPALEDWRGLLVAPERAELYARIEARFAAMIDAGALDEVRALAARGLDESLPALKAHGAPWLKLHVEGQMALSEAIALAQRDTRRYAKRQFTWMGNQFGSWPATQARDLAGRVNAARESLNS